MGLGVAKAAAATTNTKTTPGNIFASGLLGMVSRHVQQSAASSISWANRRQHYRRQHRRSAEELFCRYQRHGRYTDSCHQRKYLYTARAQHLYKTEVFAVNKYPICAALYTICIFICIYYVSVYFYKKAGLFHPAFFARKNLLYGYFPAAPSLRHAGLLSSIPTITYRYDFT